MIYHHQYIKQIIPILIYKRATPPPPGQIGTTRASSSTHHNDCLTKAARVFRLKPLSKV